MKKQAAVAEVRVSLNDGLTILDLKPGNTLTVAKIREILKNGGYPTKEATIVANGTVGADQKTFTVSGTNEPLTVNGTPPAKEGDGWRFVTAAPGSRRP